MNYLIAVRDTIRRWLDALPLSLSKEWVEYKEAFEEYDNAYRGHMDALNEYRERFHEWVDSGAHFATEEDCAVDKAYDHYLYCYNLEKELYSVMKEKEGELR